MPPAAIRAPEVPLSDAVRNELEAIAEPIDRFRAAGQIVTTARGAKADARVQRSWALWVLHALNRRRYPMVQLGRKYGIERARMSTDFTRLSGPLPKWLEPHLQRFDLAARLCDLWICPPVAARVSLELATPEQWANAKRRAAQIENLERALKAIRTAHETLTEAQRATPAPDLTVSQEDLAEVGETGDGYLVYQDGSLRVSPERFGQLLTEVSKALAPCKALAAQLARRRRADDKDFDVNAAWDEATALAMRKAVRPLERAAQPIHALLHPKLARIAQAEADRWHAEWLDARSREKTALPYRDALFHELVRDGWEAQELAAIGGVSKGRLSQIQNEKPDRPAA